MYLDQFRAAPPGNSLTGPQGKWNWEEPPRFNSPMEAVTYILDELETPIVRENYLKMMVAGISVEAIVNSLANGGFATGFFNADVAELIKMPLTMYFLGMADEYGLPVRIFSTDDGRMPMDEGMSDIELLDLMRLKNPQVYADYENMEMEGVKRDMRPTGGMLAEPPMPLAEPPMPLEEPPVAPEEPIAPEQEQEEV